MAQKRDGLTIVREVFAQEREYSVRERDFWTASQTLIFLFILGILVAIALPTLLITPQRVGGNPSAGNAANLALALFNYNTDNGSYPSGKTSTVAFMTLFPAYLQDPANLFLTKHGGHKPFTGRSIIDLSRENVCWTITMNNGAGLTGGDPTNLPTLISDLGRNYPTFPGGETKVTLTDNNVNGLDGVIVARLDQSTAFLRANAGVVTLTGPKFQPAPGAAYSSVAP